MTVAARKNLKGFRVRVLAAGLLLFFLASLALMLLRGHGLRATGENLLGNPPGMVDRLVLLDSDQSWRRGTFDGIESAGETPSTLRLRRELGRKYPRVGCWTSAVMPTDFAYTELLPSWNAHADTDTGVRVEVRVRDRRRHTFSPWLYVGSWGRVQPQKDFLVSFAHGAVNVDSLVLGRPADAMQVRVFFQSFSLDPQVTPTLRRVALCYSGVVSSASERAKLAAPVSFAGPWARDLGIPYRTQADAPASIRGEICSPTSVSMVLSFWGADRPTVENAAAIYDADHRMFGNWNRAVQRAAELGMDAWLTRFRDWDHVKAQIARGQPIVASIRFKKGEFPSAILKSTAGHLIVIRGFTPTGDVIVNDPANKKGNGVVYKADELAKAWFGHGGVGYVISRPTTPLMIGRQYSSASAASAGK